MNSNKKETLVINIIGGPGSGKTTVASGLFSKLKALNYDVENVSEFAKELVWEHNSEAFKDRLYMHAMQNHRLFQMNNKLDFIITDSPLLLTSIYNDFYLKDKQSVAYNDMIHNVVKETWALYHNITYYIEREDNYNMVGRRENADEALSIDKAIKEYLDCHNITYKVLKVNEAVETIYNEVIKLK